MNGDFGFIDELATSQLLLRIVFNILKIMTVKPEAYEQGTYLRPHAKTARGVWMPHIIGKNYRVKRSAPRSGASRQVIQGLAMLSRLTGEWGIGEHSISAPVSPKAWKNGSSLT
jgi:hypothetical protein